jgi:predicted ferric reductase
MLTLPVLIAGTVAALFAATTTTSTTSLVSTTSRRTFVDKLRSLWCIRCLSKFWSRDWTLLSVAVLVPSLIYVLSSIHRHLSKSGLTMDQKLMEVGNVFGMIAVVTLSWMLVPATKARGPLVKLFDWDPIHVLQVFHIWGGRIVVLGSVLHGLFHCVRLRLQSRQILWSYLIPPLKCWTNPQSYEPSICELTDNHGCSCYEHFRVFTGLVATIGLILIGISSLYRIRRQFFSSFALMHYVLTPLTFAMICVHYNKTILYASGGLLYYLASSYPVWIEYLWKRFRHRPVKVASIERIGADSCQSHRPCVALTLEASQAAIRRYRPGLFGHLSVPAISSVAHPFTINVVPNQPHRIRIIFRVTGNFTRSLEKALCGDLLGISDADTAASAPSSSPEMYLHGYCGSGTLLDKISSHDVCVVVAAGVGITPYLSLFAALFRTSKDGVVKDPVGALKPRKILVHWVCRDEALIQYCRREYFDPLLDSRFDVDGHSIEINIYHTGLGGDTFADDDTCPDPPSGPRIHSVDVVSMHGIPFDQSRYTAGEGQCKNLGYVLTFSLLSWGGLWVIWRWYQLQEPNAYVGRLATLVVLMLYGLIVAVFRNGCWYFDFKRKQEGWSQVDGDDAIDKDAGLENSDMGGETLEMSTYKGTEPTITTLGQFADAESQQSKAVKVDSYEERPRIDQILVGMQNGSTPALFCCVPQSFATLLCDSVNKSSCALSSVASATVYQESFEI